MTRTYFCLLNIRKFEINLSKSGGEWPTARLSLHHPPAWLRQAHVALIWSIYRLYHLSFLFPISSSSGYGKRRPWPRYVSSYDGLRHAPGQHLSDAINTVCPLPHTSQQANTLMDKQNTSKNAYRDEEKLPKSIDLSHHLSELAKRRKFSPLKGFYKYIGRPGLVVLAGGLSLLFMLPTAYKYISTRRTPSRLLSICHCRGVYTPNWCIFCYSWTRGLAISVCLDLESLLDSQ